MLKFIKNYGCVMLVMFCTLFFGNQNVKAEVVKNVESNNIFNNEEVVINDIVGKEQIKEYQEARGEEYDSDLVEIYTQTENIRHANLNDENVSLAYFGDDYYVKKQTVNTQTDTSDIIRQYRRPAGKISINESISISNTFSASGEVTSKILSAELGYDVTKANRFSINWSKNYSYPVVIKIYPTYKITKGEIWEKDVFFDDKVGSFTAKKAIGDDIRVYKSK